MPHEMFLSYGKFQLNRFSSPLSAGTRIRREISYRSGFITTRERKETGVVKTNTFQLDSLNLLLTLDFKRIVQIMFHRRLITIPFYATRLIFYGKQFEK